MDEVTVCNMALGYIGASPISKINERSANAEACNTFFNTARDATLEGSDWNFARVRRSLAPLSDESPLDWRNGFSYPTDCVKFRRILHSNRRTNDPHPFEVALRADKSSQWILTDVVNPVGVYTARVENLNLYSALAIEALAWKLASLIVVPITRKLDAMGPYATQFQVRLSMAEASSMNEQQADKPNESELVEARR